VLFADLGGPRILLSLNQSSSFHGFVSLVTLIFRHILEEKDSLRYCMEKVSNWIINVFQEHFSHIASQFYWWRKRIDQQ
jgi:hypothetical protein